MFLDVELNYLLKLFSQSFNLIKFRKTFFYLQEIPLERNNIIF